MSFPNKYIFTSESVSEGHPDKVCDQISDVILDLYLSADNNARVACETLATTNRVIVSGEVGLSINKDYVTCGPSRGLKAADLLQGLMSTYEEANLEELLTTRNASWYMEDAPEEGRWEVLCHRVGGNFGSPEINPKSY